MLEGAAVAARQREQLRQYLRWREAEGGVEGPQRLETMLAPVQLPRYEWLRRNVVGTILEVGCNWGFVLTMVKGHAGVDTNEDVIRLAQILAPKRDFRVASALALPFQNHSFETVMLPEVLEHLDLYNVPAAIMEAVRVASQRILITMPDGDFDSEEATNFKHKFLVCQDTLRDILAMVPVPATVVREYPFVYVRIDL